MRNIREAKENAIMAIIITACCLAVFFIASNAYSNEKVKYCKDANTGRIITVQAGMPCPYPTHEI